MITSHDSRGVPAHLSFTSSQPRSGSPTSFALAVHEIADAVSSWRAADVTIVETVLSRRIDDLEPQLTRHGYDVRALCEQFEAKPVEIRELLRGTLNPQRSTELIEEMRAVGLPL